MPQIAALLRKPISAQALKNVAGGAKTDTDQKAQEAAALARRESWKLDSRVNPAY